MIDWDLDQVISGGQTGADIAGVRAAQQLGYATGGYMPHLFYTDEGTKPEYAEEFGMVALAGDSYGVRTRRNVTSSDATIVFGDLTSPGCSLTWRLLRLYRKRKLHVTFSNMIDVQGTAQVIRTWIVHERIAVLNIAGNRERTQPGIEASVTAILLKALVKP